MLQTVFEFWKGLDANTASFLAGTAAQFFGSLSVEKWNCLKGDPGSRVMAACFQQWQQAMLDDAKSPQAREAFGEFFGHAVTRSEFDKLLRGQYTHMDFKALEKAVQDSCKWAKCGPPDNGVLAFLESAVDQLLVELEATAVSDPQVAPVLRETLSNIRNRTPDHRNHSLACREYSRRMIIATQTLPLLGFRQPETFKDPSLQDVFVMPRAVRVKSGNPEGDGVRVTHLVKPGARFLLLGGPGAGKSTLLRRLALGMARGDEGYPKLLPVLYRAKDFQLDRGKNSGSLLACYQARMEEESLLLPAGFLERQKRAGLAVLIDGLDEVAQRQDLMKAVQGLAEDLPSNCIVIATSRPREVEGTDALTGGRYPRYKLCEFDDGEVEAFITGWRRFRDSSQAAAAKATRDLCQVLKEKERLRKLAGTPLLLTMIACLHRAESELPDSRARLYETCTESLCHRWRKSKDLPEPDEALVFGVEDQVSFLSEFAYKMQSEAPEGAMEQEEQSLELPRGDVERELRQFLKKEGLDRALLGKFLERADLEDGVLVHLGREQYGFIHRSFQEYCAGRQMAEWLANDEIFKKLEQDGWRETVRLAVSLMKGQKRRQFLVDLLKRSMAEEALDCLTAMPPKKDWLSMLIRFLAKRTWSGREFAGLAPAECISEDEIDETLEILEQVLDKNRRDGQVMAAAVELAEELGTRGDKKAQAILDGFFAKGKEVERERIAIPAGPFLSHREQELVSVDVAAFAMDRFPVTNAEYERMVPGHAEFREVEYQGRRISDGDDDPVILVSWHEAALYARWTGGRLPTSEEWEKAAAWGPEFAAPREYPWGDWDDEQAAKLCNTRERKLGRTTPVNAHPDGKSAYGCEDMAGNVWEWTATRGSWGFELRGGSWDNARGSARCAVRYDDLPENRVNYFGFRCART